MRYSIKKLVIVTIISVIILSAFFLGITSNLLSNFDIKIVGLVSIFSISLIAICTIFVFLVSKNVNITLETLSQTIESIIDDNPKDIFSTIEDTMLSKLQSQVIKLSDILKSHNIRQRKEKDDLTSLISDISHQLKTPLANLNIYNSLLLDTSLSDDRRIEFTKNMQSQIEKLNWLMESLIKMSRLETGIIKLNIKNQSITQTVLQTILMVSPKAEQKGMNIIFSSEKDIICNHDTKWTQEAIFNILDNGIKYSPDNTEIHVSIIKYELFCRIDIQDKGDGIIESDINKIFTRFYRGENPKNIDGVGIGLFLSRKIVSQQGGYIKVKSVLGEGSVFSVFLPFEI
jgi:signal transduction histidine kinase